MDPSQLEQAGFSPEEVSQYTKLQGAGFSDDEISAHLSGGKATNPPPEGAITTGVPWWTKYAKIPLEMVGWATGGPFGYAAAKQVGSAAEKAIYGGTESPPSRLPYSPRNLRDLELAKKSAEVMGRTLSPEEEGAIATQPSILPPGLAPFTKKAEEISKDVGEGMLMGPAGEIVGKYAPKILPFYARGKTPGAQEMEQLATREGVRIPASDITQSTGQSAISSAVQKLPQSAYTMQNEAIKATSDFANYTERTLGKLGGKVEPEVSGGIAKESVNTPLASEIESQFAATGGKVTPSMTGQAVQEGIPIARKVSTDQGTQFFKKATELAKDVTPSSTFDKVAKAIDKVLESDQYLSLPDAEKKVVDNIISLIKKRTGIGSMGEAEISTAGGATVPLQVSKGGGKGFMDEEALSAGYGEAGRIQNFLQAEGFRGTLGKATFELSPTLMRAYQPLKTLYDAYLSGMADDAANAGSEAAKAFAHARQFWKQNVYDRFGVPGENNIITKLEKASPDTIVRTIKGANENDLKRLVDIIPPQTLKVLQNGILTDIAETGATKTTTGEIIYNGPQISKALNKIGDSSLNALFSKDQIRYLRDFAARGAKEGQMFKIAMGSTEYAMNRLRSASLQEVSQIKTKLSPDDFLQYRQGLITQIFQKNSQQSPITGEIIYNGPQIAKDLFGKSGLGEARLKLLMNPEELSVLRDMSKIGERMGSSWRIAGNPSGTAHTLYVLHLLSQAGSAVGGAIAGEEMGRRKGLGAGLATAGAFLSPYAVAKLITSNVGRRYLMSGFPHMERVIGKAIPYGVIATRGILGKSEQTEEKPQIRGGVLPFESRQ